MWDSTKLFFKGIFKSIYFWISLICLFYAVYDIFIKPLLPPEYQKDIYPPAQLGLILFAFLVILAGITPYHKLRMARLAELYKYEPEANKNRIFYRLLKDGQLLKNANTERRKQWDEEVFKEINNYCISEFKNNYLLETGRRYNSFAPLEDDKYDKAIEFIEFFLDKDFNSSLKI